MTNRNADQNGWLEVKDNPISKVGVFDYPGSKIDADGSKGLDPYKMYKVYRPEEELSNQECIDSFKLVPFLDDHAFLGSAENGMAAPEDQAIHGVIGENVYYDAPYLKANLKIFSDTLKEKIDIDDKRELSCGFRCKYVVLPGVWDGQEYDATQIDIRGNHLALVDSGRAGPDVMVLDHKISFTVDSKDFEMVKNSEEKEVVELALPEEIMKEKPAEDSAPKEEAEDNAPKKAAEDAEAVTLESLDAGHKLIISMLTKLLADEEAEARAETTEAEDSSKKEDKTKISEDKSNDEVDSEDTTACDGSDMDAAIAGYIGNDHQNEILFSIAEDKKEKGIESLISNYISGV